MLSIVPIESQVIALAVPPVCSQLLKCFQNSEHFGKNPITKKHNSEFWRRSEKKTIHSGSYSGVRKKRHVSVLNNMINLTTIILCSHSCSLCLFNHYSQIRSHVWRKSIDRNSEEHSLASAETLNLESEWNMLWTKLINWCWWNMKQ